MTMSDQTPLVSDAMIATGEDADHPRALTAYQVRAIYEADRQALLSVVQELVDGLNNMDRRYRGQVDCCGKFDHDTFTNNLHLISKIKSTYNIEPKP